MGALGSMTLMTPQSLGAAWPAMTWLMATGALLLAVAWVTHRLLARRSAATRHLVLCLTAVCLLAQPLLSLWLPPRLPVPVMPVTAEMDPARLLTNEGAQQVAQSTSRRIAQWAGQWAGQIGPAAIASPSTSGQPFRIVLALLLLLGIAASVARLVLGWWAARALVREAMPIDAPALLSLAERLHGELGCAGRVRLLASPRPLSPLCTGILRPVILLPRDATSWALERQRLVLLHELAHVRRRDCLLQLIMELAAALHWWNPLAWWAVRAARLEREAAADDLVASTGVRASDHAEELLLMARALLEMGGPTRRLVMTAGIAIVEVEREQEPARRFGRRRLSTLEQRLRRILAPELARDRPRPRFVLVAALVALALVVPLSRRLSLAPAAASPSSSTSSIGRSSTERLREGVTQFLLHPPATHVPSPSAGPALAPTLSIDPEVQGFVEEELDAMGSRIHPAAAGIVVIDPTTGEVRALGGRQGGRIDDALPARVAFEPASVNKVFLTAAALEAGTVKPEQQFDCRPGSARIGDRVVQDSSPHGTLRVADILALSSNIGALRILEATGDEPVRRALLRFHFAEVPTLELTGAVAGDLPPQPWSHLQAANVANGHGLRLSQVQVAASFAAIANDGIYHAPSLVKGGAGPAERLISSDTARTLLQLLEGVVQRDDGTGTSARVAGYRVAGKTGTGDDYATFVGAIPADHPRAVILIGVRPMGKQQYAGVVAAPSFATIAARTMRAWSVTK